MKSGSRTRSPTKKRTRNEKSPGTHATGTKGPAAESLPNPPKEGPGDNPKTVEHPKPDEPTPERVDWGEGTSRKPDEPTPERVDRGEGTSRKPEAEASGAEAQTTSESEAEGASESEVNHPASPPAPKPKAVKPRSKDTARIAITDFGSE